MKNPYLEVFTQRQIERTNLLSPFCNLKQNIFMTPIEALFLSIRTGNALTNAGLDTVEKVLATPIYELKKVNNLGKLSLEELRRALQEHGFDVSHWDRPPPSLEERVSALAKRVEALEGAQGDRELYEVMAAIKGLSLAQRAMVLSTIRSAIAVLRDCAAGKSVEKD